MLLAPDPVKVLASTSKDVPLLHVCSNLLPMWHRFYKEECVDINKTNIHCFFFRFTRSHAHSPPRSCRGIRSTSQMRTFTTEISRKYTTREIGIFLILILPSKLYLKPIRLAMSTCTAVLMSRSLTSLPSLFLKVMFPRRWWHIITSIPAKRRSTHLITFSIAGFRRRHKNFITEYITLLLMLIFLQHQRKGVMITMFMSILASSPWGLQISSGETEGK